MARKSAVKKESSKMTQAKASTKKAAAQKKIAKKPVKKAVKKTVAKKSAAKKQSADMTTLKAIKTLLSKGKKQGYLTYDEINETLPEDLLSPEQIDETLMLFYANNIEVVDKKHQKKVAKLKKTKALLLLTLVR